jgi:hypothetical protein
MGPALFASATVLVSVDFLLAYFPIYGTATGLSVQAVGLLLSMGAAASMCSRIFMGRLIRAKGQLDVALRGRKYCV